MKRPLATVLALAVLAPLAAQDRPNFVFFLVDDLGWRDVGFMGSKFYETPNIDRLAADGLVFTNAYACGPNCAPSRACIMSGQYAPRHGIYTVGKAARGKSRDRKLIPIRNRRVLRDEVLTIPEALRGAGYVSGHFGKWHLGPDPASQGFDVNVGGNQAGHPKSYFSPYENPDLPDGPKGEYLTERLTAEAAKFLARNKDRPFFLHLSYYAVHTPIQPKRDKVGKYRAKQPDGDQGNPRYAAMVESVDDSVGRLLAELRRLDLERNTVVVFFSDNGGHGVVTSMAPLRGAKGMLYEGGIREPLIVRWAGRIEAGGRSDVPVIGVDFFPTMLELAGVEAPPGKALDGVSLVPVLRGGTLPERALYWHFPAYLQGNRKTGGAWRTTPAGAIRVGGWKLLEFFEEGKLELYHLASDIGETANLVESHPDKVEELLTRLRAWRKRVDAQVPVERNPEYDPHRRK